MTEDSLVPGLSPAGCVSVCTEHAPTPRLRRCLRGALCTPFFPTPGPCPAATVSRVLRILPHFVDSKIHIFSPSHTNISATGLCVMSLASHHHWWPDGHRDGVVIARIHEHGQSCLGHIVVGSLSKVASK